MLCVNQFHFQDKLESNCILRILTNAMAGELVTWITGEARSGKTSQLVKQFCHWLQPHLEGTTQQAMPTAILLATNHTTAHELNQRLTAAVEGKYPVVVKTPLGFMEEEVNLYAPLWWETFQIKPQFPLRLRSETEQAFASALWHDAFPQHTIPNPRVEARLVRTTLDLLQLAGASGTPIETIPTLLRNQLSAEDKAAFGDETLFPLMGQLILQWRDWCLQRGFLTYGLIYYLYGQVLLHDPRYQEQLKDRYHAIFADDVDDYPAIAQQLASFLIQNHATAAFTFNPNGKVRLGLTADPDTWQTLAPESKQISLSPSSQQQEPANTIPLILQMVDNPSSLEPLPDCIRSLQTFSRSQLLEDTAQYISHAIQQQTISPDDIAIIAPGLDEIARYTLMQRFHENAIPVYPLNEQRPLISSPLVRALLTLTCLVYPHLGRLLEKNAVAEMLVTLTQHSSYQIDPVRAGLIADYCYQPHPDFPTLVDAKTFPRWDRIGYQAHTAYNQIRHWIEQQKAQSQSLVQFFNQGIQQFLWKGNNLSVADLASLRELTETAQHYWETHTRMPPKSTMIEDFIKLLKQGTITANPYPLTSLQRSFSQGITLANIFQYRSQRSVHRWQFWLDVSSSLWLEQGSAKLLGSEIFRYHSHQESVSADLPNNSKEQHLKRILQDLLNRATERIYLCHSDLAINGTEQTGLLYSLVQASTPTTASQIVAKG